jgi:hypothetical protein
MKKTNAWTLAGVKQELAEIGRIGQMFVDGDLCRKAWNPHAETFMCGDDMDYNPETTVPLKKTLFRLERLCRVPCSTALWRRRPDIKDSGEALLFGSSSSPLGGDKPANRGYQPPKMTPELKAVFLRGKDAWKQNPAFRGIPILVGRGLEAKARDVKKPMALQYFVPIKDSMGDIAAALEVFTIVTRG